MTGIKNTEGSLFLGLGEVRWVGMGWAPFSFLLQILLPGFAPSLVVTSSCAFSILEYCAILPSFPPSSHN